MQVVIGAFSPDEIEQFKARLEEKGYDTSAMDNLQIEGLLCQLVYKGLDYMRINPDLFALHSPDSGLSEETFH